MRDDQQQPAELLQISNMEKQCVLDAIRDAIGQGDITKATYRSREAAKAALAGIATLRGNHGPVVAARQGQSPRQLADELEEVASQLRLTADEWDAELERINDEANEARRTAPSVPRGSEEEGNPDTSQGYSLDQEPRETPGQGGASE